MNSYTNWPAEGFLRLAQIIGTSDRRGPVPISRAKWYQLVRAGAVPQPVQIGPRTSAYHVSEIRELMQLLADGYTYQDLAGYWPKKANKAAIANGGNHLGKRH